MFKEIQELKERYVNATTDKEREEINKQMSELRNKDNEAFANAMLQTAKDTTEKANNLLKKVRKREQLESILPILPLSYIAKEYFNKSRQWLYQRINGNIVNGKPAQFTEKETEILNFAIQDISKKIGSISII